MSNPSELRLNLCALAVCIAIFLPDLDKGLSISYERWQAQRICRAHHFDYAVNTGGSAVEPAWECEVRGPMAQDGAEPRMAVYLMEADRFEVEAINFRHNGVRPRE